LDRLKFSTKFKESEGHLQQNGTPIGARRINS